MKIVSWNFLSYIVVCNFTEFCIFILIYTFIYAVPFPSFVFIVTKYNTLFIIRVTAIQVKIELFKNLGHCDLPRTYYFCCFCLVCDFTIIIFLRFNRPYLNYSRTRAGFHSYCVVSALTSSARFYRPHKSTRL